MKLVYETGVKTGVWNWYMKLVYGTGILNWCMKLVYGTGI